MLNPLRSGIDFRSAGSRLAVALDRGADGPRQCGADRPGRGVERCPPRRRGSLPAGDLPRLLLVGQAHVRGRPKCSWGTGDRLSPDTAQVERARVSTTAES